MRLLRAAHPTEGLSPSLRDTLEQAANWINQLGVKQTAEERAANLGAVLSAQAHYLVEKCMARQAVDFEQGGGFSERLYQARTAHRRTEENRQKGQNK